MTDHDKRQILIDKISDVLENERTDYAVDSLVWVLANVIVYTAEENNRMSLATKVMVELRDAVMFLVKEEGKEEEEDKQ